jgi:hypothetical protein
LNSAALQHTLLAQGQLCYDLITERCPHLFADVPVFISPAQLQQMMDVIAVVERVVNSGQWIQTARVFPAQLRGEAPSCCVKDSGLSCVKGVFYGYDFHLNTEGAHLIEINTNAGGAFLNAMLLDSQREVSLPGKAVAEADLEQVFLAMFLNEWRLARGDVPLTCIAIVDENPEQQYLYPEFLLAQALFERAGIKTCLVDPGALQARETGLYFGDQKIDLLYNRLTDFSLQQHSTVLNAYLAGSVLVTPNPAHYARYADKRNLARLTDADALRQSGVDETDIATLQTGIPHTFIVQENQQVALWVDRKSLFFKPNCGYGSRGAYRGDKLTRRVFGEILQADYVAQQLAVPGERCVAEGVTLKYDVRCYVYDGKIQLVAARLYQGQTTNFRTPGGGFAPVRLLR